VLGKYPSGDLRHPENTQGPPHRDSSLRPPRNGCAPARRSRPR